MQAYGLDSWVILFCKVFHKGGLVQDCSNPIANALELLPSCINPSVSSLSVALELGSHHSHANHKRPCARDVTDVNYWSLVQDQ